MHLLLRLSFFQPNLLIQGKRTCFHPGVGSTGHTTTYTQFGKDVGSNHILKQMLSFVWPKDKPWIRRRVVLALGLLIGAKVCPFLVRIEQVESNNTDVSYFTCVLYQSTMCALVFDFYLISQPHIIYCPLIYICMYVFLFLKFNVMY